MKETKPRVLICSTSYFPFVGGAEVAIQEITKRMDDFSFELITARFDETLPKEEHIENVLVHRVGFGSSLDKVLLPLLGVFKVLSIIRTRGIDIFWPVMASFASGVPYIVNILRPKQRIPVVLTLQEGDSEAHIESKRFGLWGLVWKLCMAPVLVFSKHKNEGMIATSWRLALARSDMVTVISTYLEERTRHYGYTGPLKLVPNGVDRAHFGKMPDLQKKEALLKQLNKKENERYIITVSRLEEKNAVDDIVRALTHLPESVKLLIAGEGSDAEMLYNLARQLGVDKRVLFLGHVHHDELPLYLSVSDVFVRPSLSEGFGNVFVEAMAAGVPVVATPVGGIPDFLFDPERSAGAHTRRHVGKAAPTGLFCEVRKPLSIAHAVKRLFKDDELRKRIITNAREMVRAKYDWWQIAEQMRRQVFGSLDM